MSNGHTGLNNFGVLKAIICHPNIFNLHWLEAIKAKPKILQVTARTLAAHCGRPSSTATPTISPAAVSGEGGGGGLEEGGRLL